MHGEIGIINYKAGNGQSVLNAFERIGAKARLVNDPKDSLKKVSALVLPGVGAASAAMESLDELGWTEHLHSKVLIEGLPFLGICVGMQILFDYSKEGDTKCLGFLKGSVEKFDDSLTLVPQMGWNSCKFAKADRLIEGLNDNAYYYFVNSYYVKAKDSSVILATTDYGLEFCSMLSYNNIYATQFHPEKSGDNGLNLLKNFAKGVNAIC